MNKILMIDDDLDDQYFYKDLFHQSSNELDFKCVAGFEELNEKYLLASKGDSFIPDLILLDLNLPKVSGIQIFKKLKEHERYNSIPVAVLTTSSSPLDMSECRNIGVDSYFVKPIEYEDCKKLVETIYRFCFEFNGFNNL
jgi:DNA-binding response OmpR family regulator